MRNTIKDVIKELQGVAANQLPFATAKTLTDTAKIVKADLIKEMRRVFDRPTPYTLNSLYLQPATKKNLQAKVWVKDGGGKGVPASKYLQPEIFGGKRRLKGFEQILSRLNLLPRGFFAVPGEAIELDRFGNINRSKIRPILNDLKKRKKNAKYFIGSPGGKQLGIWQRFSFAHGSAVKPIIMFVRQPVYKEKLKFFEISEKAINKNFAELFRKNAAYALATRGKN